MGGCTHEGVHMGGGCTHGGGAHMGDARMGVHAWGVHAWGGKGGAHINVLTLGGCSASGRLYFSPLMHGPHHEHGPLLRNVY